MLAKLKIKIKNLHTNHHVFYIFFSVHFNLYSFALKSRYLWNTWIILVFFFNYDNSAVSPFQAQNIDFPRLIIKTCAIHKSSIFRFFIILLNIYDNSKLRWPLIADARAYGLYRTPVCSFWNIVNPCWLEPNLEVILGEGQIWSINTLYV